MEHTIIRVKSVPSTNDYIRQFSEGGTIVLADTQTAGRGRQGRGFQSVPGAGIYFSMLLKPKVDIEQVFSLTPVAAQGVCDAIERLTGVRPKIKWINDILMDGRKICGILTELMLAPDGRVDKVILGIGINVNQKLEDFDASLGDIAGSIAMATGKTWDKEVLTTALIDALDRRIADWEMGNTDVAGYCADCATLGREVSVIRGDCARTGYAETIADDFSLVVRWPDGTRAQISSGEVSVRGLAGYQ